MNTRETGRAVTMEFKDRRGGLIAFGILQILIGALCAFVAPMILVGMLAPPPPAGTAGGGLSPDAMIPALLCYAGLAVGFISLGIGSVLALRWARAMTLIFSWIWLVGGLLGLLIMAAIMPDMFAQMPNDAAMPAEVLVVIKLVMFVLISVIYVVLPAAFVFFYSSRHVKATCEWRDPRERWTDRCPLPVLAVSLMAALWAACMPMLGTFGWVLPFFGAWLTGPAGAALALAVMAAMAWIAWGTYRLRPAAWAGAVVLVCVWGLSYILTLSRHGMWAIYERMNFPPEQLEMMKQMPLMRTSWISWSIAIWAVLAIGYLLYVRRFFRPSAPSPAA